MSKHICLASFDEAAAADGSCPLEQIADASGVAVGGTVLQRTRDLSRVKVLMTHSKSLTPAQQNWPPLIQEEAYAQLEVKRATRKTFLSAPPDPLPPLPFPLRRPLSPVFIFLSWKRL